MPRRDRSDKPGFDTGNDDLNTALDELARAFYEGTGRQGGRQHVSNVFEAVETVLREAERDE